MKARIAILLLLSIAFMTYSGVIFNRPENELYFLTFTNSAAALIAQILSACFCLAGMMQALFSVHK